jgi:hypothetical protein
MAKVKHIPSQNTRIIEYLGSHEGITHLEAEQKLGICRLASRITDLRRLGYLFDTEWVEVKNRWGEKTRVKRYRLAVEE